MQRLQAWTRRGVRARGKGLITELLLCLFWILFISCLIFFYPPLLHYPSIFNSIVSHCTQPPPIPSPARHLTEISASFTDKRRETVAVAINIAICLYIYITITDFFLLNPILYIKWMKKMLVSRLYFVVFGFLLNPYQPQTIYLSSTLCSKCLNDFNLENSGEKKITTLA